LGIVFHFNHLELKVTGPDLVEDGPFVFLEKRVVTHHALQLHGRGTANHHFVQGRVQEFRWDTVLQVDGDYAAAHCPFKRHEVGRKPGVELNVRGKCCLVLDVDG
jgi:hypothetical protein